MTTLIVIYTIMDIANEIASQYNSEEVFSALIDLLGIDEAEYIYTDSEGNVYAIVMRLEQKEREELLRYLS